MSKMKLSQKELTEVIQFFEETSQKAGKILLKNQKKIQSLKVSSKDAAGVASEADIASEKLIIKEIKKHYPQATVLAEEDAFKKFGNSNEAFKHFSKEELCFIVDPLDGTHNYLASMDYYAICLSLVHFGKPVAGLVYRPATGDSYFATLKGGTFKKNWVRNKRKKRLSFTNSTKKLKDSMLVTGFATEKGVLFDKEFEIFKNLMGHSRGVRRMGSAALDLCLVAEGIFDGFWERGLAPWDVAAAGLICQEAGVKVSDYYGDAFTAFDETILAARPRIHKDLLKHVGIK